MNDNRHTTSTEDPYHHDASKHAIHGPTAGDDDRRWTAREDEGVEYVESVSSSEHYYYYYDSSTHFSSQRSIFSRSSMESMERQVDARTRSSPAEAVGVETLQERIARKLVVREQHRQQQQQQQQQLQQQQSSYTSRDLAASKALQQQHQAEAAGVEDLQARIARKLVVRHQQLPHEKSSSSSLVRNLAAPREQQQQQYATMMPIVSPSPVPAATTLSLSSRRLVVAANKSPLMTRTTTTMPGAVSSSLTPTRKNTSPTTIKKNHPASSTAAAAATAARPVVPSSPSKRDITFYHEELARLERRVAEKQQSSPTVQKTLFRFQDQQDPEDQQGDIVFLPRSRRHSPTTGAVGGTTKVAAALAKAATTTTAKTTMTLKQVSQYPASTKTATAVVAKSTTTLQQVSQQHPSSAFDWLLDATTEADDDTEQPTTTAIVATTTKKRQTEDATVPPPPTGDHHHQQHHQQQQHQDHNFLPTAKRITNENDDLEYAVQVDFEETLEYDTMVRQRRHRHRCYLYWSLLFITLVCTVLMVVGLRARPLPKQHQRLQHPREYIGIRPVAELLLRQQHMIQEGDDDNGQQEPPEFSRALDWIVHNDTVLITDANFYQRLVMAGIYFSTNNGDDDNANANNSSWQGNCGNSSLVWCTILIGEKLKSARPWLTEFPECEWAGITCDAQQNVVEVRLDNVVRHCPVVPFAWLRHLPFLRTIQMTKAECEQLPDLSYQMARHYRTIGLDHNDFRNKIPTSWYAALPNLRVLQLSGNFMTGSLPSDLSRLQSLKRLDLQANRFTGTIPDIFHQLKSIAFVWLNGNRFAGRIPPTLLQIGGIYSNQTVSAVAEIDLGENRLTGEIPAVANRSWNTLRFDRNLLSGTLPSSLVDQTETLELDVSFNRLTGTISSKFGEWNNVARLDLSNNVFTGPLPPEIRRLPVIEKLNLNRNEFRGSVPEAWCQRETLGLHEIKDLRADCLAEIDGFVETPCSCCSVCCNDNGSACLATNPGED